MKTAYYKVKSLNRDISDSMLIEVSILDRKDNYGWTLCLITPVKGIGRIWVRERTLQLI